MQLSSRLVLKTATIMLGMIMLLVIMLSMIGGSGDAAFYSYRPDLSITWHDAHWGSYADYLAGNLTVTYTISNGIGSDAYDVQLTGATANNGVSLTSATPVSVGDIAVGGSANADLNYDVPDGVLWFHNNITGTAKDLNGTSYPYPLNPDNLVYVEGTSGNPRISVVDTSSMTVVNQFTDYTIASGQSHRIQVSPDGKYLWNGENNPTRATGFVQVLDAATGVQVKKWDIGNHNGPTMGNWTKGGHHYLFFPAERAAPDGAISIFDVEAQTLIGTIPVGDTPNHIWDTTADGNTLWGTVGSGVTSKAVAYDITNIDTGVIPTTRSAEVTIGGSLHALAVDPVRSRVYVGSSNGGVNVIDTTTNTVIAWKAGGIATSHNFTMSPENAYLVVGESSTYGCTEEVHDPLDPAWPHDGTRGPFVWFLNLDTLTVDKYFESQALGKSTPSHQSYTRDGAHIMMSMSWPGDPNGKVMVADPDTLALETIINVVPGPHSIGIPGGVNTY